jgi:hypothetical protein
MLRMILVVLILVAPVFAQLCGPPYFCLSTIGCSRGHCDALDDETIGIEGPAPYPVGSNLGPVPAA